MRFLKLLTREGGRGKQTGKFFTSGAGRREGEKGIVRRRRVSVQPEEFGRRYRRGGQIAPCPRSGVANSQSQGLHYHGISPFMLQNNAIGTPSHTQYTWISGTIPLSNAFNVKRPPFPFDASPQNSNQFIPL